MFNKIIFALLTFFALGTSQGVLAAEPLLEESVAAQPMPEKPDSAATNQQSVKLQPNNDKLVDYRYCLDFKNDKDIAECRYKK